MLDLYKNIKRLREEKGLSQDALAKLTGYTDRSSITKIEKGQIDLQQSKIELFAKALGTTSRELVGWSEETVIPEEFEWLIKNYQKLDPTGQEHINTFLDWEVKRAEQLKQAKAPAAIIEFQSSSNENNRMVEYFRSASAGSGVFILGNEVAEQIAIPNTPENRAVDFAIKVSGDSMFPDYADGDIVLVSQKAELFHGDIGIFIINNNTYIKEYGEKELISRNPDADNIQIAEYDNIVCMGKVIGKL